MASPQLGNLADAAGYWILVALAARLRVEERSESVSYSLNLLELGSIKLVCRLIDKDARQSIEARRGFSCALTFGRSRHCDCQCERRRKQD